MPEVDVSLSRSSARSEIRAGVIDAAARILAEEGLAALTVRRVADRVNASTKVVYTLFGGKEGLLEAVYLGAFDRLSAEMVGPAARSDPRERVLASARTYRLFALAHPDLYSVMFGEAAVGFQPSLEARRHGWATFKAMRTSLVECRPSMTERDADFAMRAVWAAMHGVVSLELREILGPAEMSDALLITSVSAICARFDIDLPEPPTKKTP
ncbi:TetR/AcrR family transcriptional regulator [Brevundimonas sp.]|uniref:TetR/AcrR family transcriptional regulator n=1 Tax=Brevundimonas sp. TaxID=1871086 RepID=UPI003D14DF69